MKIAGVYNACMTRRWKRCGVSPIIIKKCWINSSLITAFFIWREVKKPQVSGRGLKPCARCAGKSMAEIARSACATMRVSRKISIYRAQRSQQGCSLSLGMLRLAEPPTGRARLRSSLESPRNPITPIETSRVATLHPGLDKGLREGGRRVIGASDARELLPPPAGGARAPLGLGD